MYFILFAICTVILEPDMQVFFNKLLQASVSASASTSKSRGQGGLEGAWEGPIPGKRFSDLVSRLRCCANTSDRTAIKVLLTAQAFPLSEASLSRQQVSGMPCARLLLAAYSCRHM